MVFEREFTCSHALHWGGDRAAKQSVMYAEVNLLDTVEEAHPIKKGVVTNSIKRDVILKSRSNTGNEDWDAPSLAGVPMS